MAKVFVEITMSLDGFVAGPNDSPELGLGEGGEALHEWVYGLASWREPHGLAGGEVGRDSEILQEAIERTGAVVLGKRMFENAKEWGDEPPFHVPVFVLTHDAREPLAKKGTTFKFTLSEAATVTFAIERKTSGRRVKGKCVKKTRTNARNQKCGLFKRVGAFRAQRAAGPNRKKFSGRIGKTTLKPGSYRALLTAVDAAGNKSKPARIAFTVVKPK